MWQQKTAISKDLAAQLIKNQIGIQVNNISFLGRGLVNIAYLINDNYVFRFPTRPIAINCMYNEIALLPYIKKFVDFPFSHPEFIGKITTTYTSPFAGYTLLQGTPLSDSKAELIDNADFARTLANWIKQLHTIPIKPEHIDTIQNDQAWRFETKKLIEQSKKIINAYKNSFVTAGFDLQELFEVLEYVAQYNYNVIGKKSYCHGDLYARHLLINQNKELTGIIDWGEIHIGSPGADLAIAFTIFTPKVQKIFFEQYGTVKEEIYNFAQLKAVWHSIALLSYCFEQTETSLKNWAILALRQSIESIKTIPLRQKI